GCPEASSQRFDVRRRFRRLHPCRRFPMRDAAACRMPPEGTMTFARPIAVWTMTTAWVVMASAGLSPRVEAQRPAAVTTVNWPLHNLDLAGSRYSTMDQINASNVKTLTPRWLFQ